ncbi:hypothetical protein [Maricaulis sp.]|uniref:hypothetical protein n=1 Tax=Maricaulis sp. TaxID=1486257 RepID=UPI001B153F57|nr:hypothetical protein [Maricaulis sp.]MBO6765305.1 hypothetical protein [Maricaulis sp.]
MAIVGINQSLLTSWYSARVTTATVGSSPLAQSAAGRNQAGEDVAAPWELESENLQTLEEMRRRVMATQDFFLDPGREFSDVDAPDDHKALFSLHQGLKRLVSLAEEARDKTTNDARRMILEKAFQNGLGQLDEYFQGMRLEELTLLKGEELRKIESDVAVSRGLSQFKSGIIHTGEYDAEVPSLTGDVQFNISVKKNGVTTDVAINLADMGGQTRNLDNIVAHINTELEAAGMVTRFERTKIGEKNDIGVIPGNDHGFLVRGVSTEQISFSAPAAQPALYFAGVSGINETAGGQIVKLTDLASGDPSIGYSTRFSADPTKSEVDVVGGEDGETRTKLVDNPLEIQATAAAADGGIFVVGKTTASTDGQTLKGEQDLVLAKYDSAGNRVWSRVLGAADDAEGASVAVDADGNVVVTGQVTGGLGDTTDIGGSDSFVAKYNAAGVEQWVQRFGGTGDDKGTAVAVGDDGTIYVAGKAASAFGNQPHQGGVSDGYLRAIGTDGQTLWTRRIGDTGDETVSAIAVADDGNILVASNEGGTAVLRKFDASDNTAPALWEQSLGDLDDGSIGGIAVDGTDVYITGAAGSAFAPSAPVGAHNGGVRDAFVVKLTDGASASVDYTTFVGSDSDDGAAGIQVFNGKVYIAGKTLGGINGDTLNGERDAFAAQLDAATGALDWSHQMSGRNGLSQATGLAIGAGDDSVLDALGLPSGTLTYSDTRVVTDRSSAREGDHFYVSVDGGRRKKITIDGDDTMRSLTFKINAALVLNGTADVRRSSDGDQLRIKAAEGKTIELFAGADGRDLLESLGIQPGAIVNTGSLLDDDEKTSDSPPLFALELPVSMSLADEKSAESAFEAIQDAMSKVQRAYREITMDPALKALLEGPQAGKKGGTVPAYYSAQLANYQAGLSRLSAGPPAGAGLFL